MKVSKLELTKRLSREGRWVEASKFKDDLIREFRSDGMSRLDAGANAWDAMEAKYPPLGEVGIVRVDVEPETSESDSELDALLEKIGEGRRSDLTLDTLWVYENLANKRIKASDAPSCGAWALLGWARKYQNRFFEQILPKAMAVSSNSEDDAELVREEKRSLADVTRVLEKMSGDK